MLPCLPNSLLLCVRCFVGLAFFDRKMQDDDEVEMQEEQRRIERKTKRQDDDSGDEEGDDGGDEEGEEGVGGSSGVPPNSDKTKKQEAKNAKQKVRMFDDFVCVHCACAAAHRLLLPPHQANRKEKKKLKLRASALPAATGQDVVEDLEFSD
jgi:hypothetical protein